jgi:RNA polymerase sigma-70 factor, ECF subfamily
VPLSSPPSRALSLSPLWAEEKRPPAVVIPITSDAGPASDESLMARLLDGQKDALAELFRRYSRLVFSIGLRVLRDTGEAEEIVQEVFLYVHQKVGQFDASRGMAKAWIAQIAQHRAIDRRGFLGRRHFYVGTDLTLLADTLAGNDDLEREIVSKLNRAHLQQAFEDLSDKQRLTLELYFFEGLELREIAERMNESSENVRHYYYRGLQKLRKNSFVQSLKDNQKK